MTNPSQNTPPSPPDSKNETLMQTATVSKLELLNLPITLDSHEYRESYYVSFLPMAGKYRVDKADTATIAVLKMSLEQKIPVNFYYDAKKGVITRAEVAERK